MSWCVSLRAKGLHNCHHQSGLCHCHRQSCRKPIKTATAISRSSESHCFMHISCISCIREEWKAKKAPTPKTTSNETTLLKDPQPLDYKSPPCVLENMVRPIWSLARPKVALSKTSCFHSNAEILVVGASFPLPEKKKKLTLSLSKDVALLRYLFPQRVVRRYGPRSLHSQRWQCFRQTPWRTQKKQNEEAENNKSSLLGWVHQNRASPFASDFYLRPGYRREFRGENHLYPFFIAEKSGFASDFLRRGNRASWGLKKSRDFSGSGKNRRRNCRESRDFGALSYLAWKSLDLINLVRCCLPNFEALRPKTFNNSQCRDQKKGSLQKGSFHWRNLQNL